MTFFSDTKFLPSRLTHKVEPIMQPVAGEGLDKGSGVGDGWFTFLDKRSHKVVTHSTGPICSGLAAVQLLYIVTATGEERRLNDAEEPFPREAEGEDAREVHHDDEKKKTSKDTVCN